MMQDYIITVNHIKFTPCDPRQEDIKIEDIAHALSLLCRANGHFRQFFSVAQHCLTCCVEAQARGYSKKVQLACLLHDASEAYLSDITRPVKQHLHKYLEIEEKLENVIYEHFIPSGLSDLEREQIKSVDDDLLYYEFYHFTGEKLYEQPPKIASDPAFETSTFSQTEAAFLTFYEQLKDSGK